MTISMIPQQFTTSMGDLESSADYSNLADQVKASKHLVTEVEDDKRTLICLESGKGLMFAILNYSSDSDIQITPIPAMHAVGDTITGDTWTELLSILESGFNYNPQSGRNAIVYGKQDPNYGNPWTRKSDLDGTRGDRFLLNIYTFQSDEVSGFQPILLPDKQDVRIFRAEPSDMEVLINLSETHRNDEALVTFYEDKLNTHQMKYVEKSIRTS